jgi:ATP-dependent Lon protease
MDDTTAPVLPTVPGQSAMTAPSLNARSQKKPLDEDQPLSQELQELANSLESARVPTELNLRLEGMITRLNRSSGQTSYLSAYEEMVSYIDWIVSLPWDKVHQDNLDLRHAQSVLNQNHYGLIAIKQRILEYLSVLTLQSRSQDENLVARSPILCFVGLPGIGKTSIASSIAESLGRPFIRIPMGGMGTSAQLRGQERSLPSAEPGQIIKSLRRIQVKNPVILLDEIDRTAESARAEIMGVLLELLDPEQNNAFSDAYIDYPFNLSKVLFLASANNTNGIANAVLDRLEVIQMPGYSDEEKIHIAKEYLFPRQLRFANITADMVTVDDEVWPRLVRPLGFDAGIRTMERILNGVVRKIALQIVAHQTSHFHLTTENFKQYLPA